MRVLLRVLAPLLGIVLAAAGVLIVIEVVAAWVRPDATAGLVVPWARWRAAVENVTWAQDPVPAVAIVVAAAGLLLVLLGLAARRSDITLDVPQPDITVTTSARVLARLVGRQVRATDGVAAASVTATRRRISVAAHGWGDSGPELREVVEQRVDELLDHLPLRRRPRLTVFVQERDELR